MAINRGPKQKTETIPATLENLLMQGFTFQAVREKYGDAFDEIKVKVTNYLEHNTDGFEVDMGKGFKCEQGTVIYAARNTWEMNKDKLVTLVRDGKVTIETLINLASFNAEKLKAAIGDADFEKIATNKQTEYLTFKANPEFKESVSEKFSNLFVETEREAAPRKTSLADAQAAAARAGSSAAKEMMAKGKRK